MRLNTCRRKGETLWRKIGDANQKLGEIFQSLRRKAVDNQEEYTGCVEAFASLPNAEVSGPAVHR